MSRGSYLIAAFASCFTFGAAILSCAPAQAADLPVAGHCKDLAEATLLLRDLQWKGDTATIRAAGNTEYTGKVYMRKTERGFKASIFFPDKTYDEIEIVLYSASEGDQTIYRMAWVGLDILPDGTRLSNAMYGFNEVDCITL